ncbi:hypothetical protein A3D69_01805 [Candidatus Uhrbacteria bacterium RIFCSPHIGHO2_02_FULL_54_11]|nr:MAG: hypothetical protein A3D69_01805 [Candidatus Uhrbacteria bacterium RIFCSPHIGHO2_02_FULL_54_11]
MRPRVPRFLFLKNKCRRRERAQLPPSFFVACIAAIPLAPLLRRCCHRRIQTRGGQIGVLLPRVALHFFYTKETGTKKRDRLGG